MRAVLVVFCLMMFVTVADAKCSGPHFNLVWDGEISLTKTSNNGRCGIRVNGSQTPIYAAEIVTQPQHGQATVRDRLHVRYTASAGYTGRDSFTFQWIGKKGGVTPSAAKVNVTVIVNQ
jgi:hypothetical protein